MNRNFFLPLCVAFSLAASPAFSNNTPPSTDTSVLICRSQQCAAVEYSVSKEFIFNKLTALFEQNQNKNALLCEADAVNHICINNAIEVPVRSSIVPSTAKISSFEIIDSKVLPNSTLDLILDYNISVNDLKPICQSARATIDVPFINKIQLNVPDFSCRITETGNTSVNTTFAIDYIDFDYGILGVHYTVGFGEVFKGGKTGYALMRFTEKLDMSDVDMGAILTPKEKTKAVKRSVKVTESKPILYAIQEQNQGRMVPVTHTIQTDNKRIILNTLQEVPKQVEPMYVVMEGPQPVQPSIEMIDLNESAVKIVAPEQNSAVKNNNHTISVKEELFVNGEKVSETVKTGYQLKKESAQSVPARIAIETKPVILEKKPAETSTQESPSVLSRIAKIIYLEN